MRIQARRLGATLSLATLAVPLGTGIAPPAAADTDAQFANELHSYGIYGQRDYNASIAKISCKRLATGLDANALESAAFLGNNLEREITTEQRWQFLTAAIRTYCSDQIVVLTPLQPRDTPTEELP